MERCIMNYGTHNLFQCSWRGCEECNTPAKDLSEEVDFEAESILSADGWMGEDGDRGRGRDRPSELDISVCDGGDEVAVCRYDRSYNDLRAEGLLCRGVFTHTGGRCPGRVGCS